MLVTGMSRSRAASMSTTLNPVACTPMYFRSGSCPITSRESSTLLVMTISAPPGPFHRLLVEGSGRRP